MQKAELTHLRMVASSAACGGAPDKLLKVGQVKEIYELKGAGRSIREIARELDVSRNTVRRYLKSPEAMRPKARPPRGSKLDPHLEYIDLRMAEGLENCPGSGDPRPGLPGQLFDGGAIRASVSSARRCGLRRRLVSRRRWTGAVVLHWGHAASGCL